MSDEPKKRRWWARAGTWWAAMFVVFVVYPLSIGPACSIFQRAGISLQWLDFFYEPFIAVVRKSHFASVMLAKYLDLWP